MTKGRESDAKRHFALTWLPWGLGLIGLGLYLVTLNRTLSFLPDWMTFFGAAPSGVRIAGWSWQPEYYSPAYYVATYPLHWLPAKWVPLATNLFSAICALLTFIARPSPLSAVDNKYDDRHE